MPGLLIVAEHGEVTDLGRYAAGLLGLAEWLRAGATGRLKQRPQRQPCAWTLAERLLPAQTSAVQDLDGSDALPSPPPL